MKFFRLMAPMALALSGSATAQSQDTQTARDVVERGLSAHGGDAYIDPQTLQLSGTATFYDAATGEVRSTADDYRMCGRLDHDPSPARRSAV